MSNLSVLERGRIVTMWEQGYNKTDIATELKVSRRTVIKWVHRHENVGNVDTRGRPPKPKIINAERLEQMRAAYLRHPLTPTREFAQKFECSTETVRKALHVLGIHHRTPAKKKKKRNVEASMSEARSDDEQLVRSRPLYASSKLRASADRELIECVRMRPILYDPTHSRYMDNPLKMSLWHKIARQLKASPNACKARWNNIRDNYRKSLRRHPSTRYKYSGMLGFMDPFYKMKPKPGDDREHQPDNEYTQDDDDISNDATVEDEKDPDAQETSETAEQLEISSIKVDQSDVEADQSESMVDYEFFEKSSTRVSRSYPSQEQAVEAFLGALAPPLKAMSPYHLSLAKAEIFATVHKYELKGIVEAGWGEKDPLP